MQKQTAKYKTKGKEKRKTTGIYFDGQGLGQNTTPFLRTFPQQLHVIKDLGKDKMKFKYL